MNMEYLSFIQVFVMPLIIYIDLQKLDYSQVL